MIRVVGAGGFWLRAAAIAVDWLWLFVLAGVVSILLTGVALPVSARGISPLHGGIVWTLHNVMPAAILVLSWWWCGTSPGKFLVELRIVDHRTGGPPSFWRLVLRYVGYFLSILPLGLGFLVAVFNRDRRTLHDFLAGTRVVAVRETDLELAPGAVG
jgi:uncharacterized RDD family membrane protein YckC